MGDLAGIVGAYRRSEADRPDYEPCMVCLTEHTGPCCRTFQQEPMLNQKVCRFCGIQRMNHLTEERDQ